MKANVKKDADGLDNIDDFWDDEDNDGATDNDQYETHDAEQDDFSGNDEEEEVHPSPSVRKPDPRRYLEQEAPEELLLTPTSRRSRGGSKGTISRGVPSMIYLAREYDTVCQYFHSAARLMIFSHNFDFSQDLTSTLAQKDPHHHRLIVSGRDSCLLRIRQTTRQSRLHQLGEKSTNLPLSPRHSTRS